MSNKISTALNTQVNNELFSAYLYLSMSAYFQSNNLSGFARWFKLQAQEETMHAMKIYDFILDRGWQIDLLPIEQPEKNWNSPTEIFAAAYEHEQKVTKMINDLFKLSIEHSDYATNTFLQWFVNEQIEEEATVSEILDKIKLTEGVPSALLFMDAELAKRAAPTNILSE